MQHHLFSHNREVQSLVLSFLLFFLFSSSAIAGSFRTTRQDTAKTTQKDNAQKETKRKVRIVGKVNDSFTNASLPALVTVMNPDSSFVDSMTCWNWRLESGYSFSVPAVNGRKYIIKAEYEGYETAYLDYELKYANRKSYFELPNLLMKREIHESINLDGVVVTGTKVKFTYHGDTLVYNASAFNMPEGSMLDGLIKQMPGAELKSNGDIYINGRKIDYLTLNGKDFFKGDNKMMLENLPYYTVNNIKVFDKSSEKSELAGREVEKKDYVMDVNLKREYSKGYMANAEAGIGSHGRWQARAFGLRYTDHSRLSLMGNVNNVNDSSEPGSEGEWWDRTNNNGRSTHKRVGTNLDLENKQQTIKNNLSASASWRNEDTQTRTSSLTFAEAGDISRWSQSASRIKNFNLNVRNQFTIKKPFRLYTTLIFNYTDNKDRAESSDSTWRQALINRSWSASYGKTRNLNGIFNTYFYQELPWGDDLQASFNITTNRAKPSDGYSLNRTLYADNDSTDLRHRYADTRNHSYLYNGSIGYGYHMNAGWTLTPSFTYLQSYQDRRNYSYRLDWLYNSLSDAEASDPYRTEDDRFLSPGTRDLRYLPSTRDSLQMAMDISNSNHYNMLSRNETYELELAHSASNSWLRFALPLTHTSQRLNYQNAVVDTLARRSYWQLSPSFFAYGWGEKLSYYAHYGFSNNRPDLVSLMPNANTSSALSTTINNPHLKSTITHSAEGRIGFSKKHIQQDLAFVLSFNYTKRSIGTRTTYDTSTGHYTYMQDNVDKPNYTLSGQFGWDRSLDSLGLKHFAIETRTSGNYNHSVDFDIAYNTESDVLSKVNNLTLGQYLRLTYQKDKLTLSAFADFSYRHATGNRANFQKINTRDLRYGLTGEYELPFKLQLATDLTEYVRDGYQTRQMNRDYLVWNAQVSYPFLKGKLIAKVKAFDILGKIESTSYNLNAQGRTETWTNSLSRYVMFSLAWKFNKSPKK